MRIYDKRIHAVLPRSTIDEPDQNSTGWETVSDLEVGTLRVARQRAKTVHSGRHRVQ